MRVRAATLAAIAALATLPSIAGAQAVVGVYEVEFKPSNGPNAAAVMPPEGIVATLTIKEENGALTATIWRHGDNDGHPMSVTTSGKDLILDTQTARGALHVTLQQQGQDVSGSWSLAGELGAVKGRKTS